MVVFRTFAKNKIAKMELSGMLPDILSYIGTLVAGGGLSAFFMAKANKKKANAEADKEASDNWREWATEMKAEMREYKRKLDNVEDEVMNLKQIVLQGYKCEHLRNNPGIECPVIGAYNKKASEE